jgi:hypothetical protein
MARDVVNRYTSLLPGSGAQRAQWRAGGPNWAPLGRWVRWPMTPTTIRAGSSVPPPYRRLAAGGRGRACWPRLIGHRPVLVPQPQVQVLSTCPGIGCDSRRPLAKRKVSSDRHNPPSRAHFHNLARSCTDPDWRSTPQPAHIRAVDRSSGTPAVLPSRYVASVDHAGLLRRSPRCSVITQHARMPQRPSQRPPPFLHVRPRALRLECGLAPGPQYPRKCLDLTFVTCG